LGISGWEVFCLLQKKYRYLCRNFIRIKRMVEEKIKQEGEGQVRQRQLVAALGMDRMAEEKGR
jgi:hypothetical protein